MVRFAAFATALILFLGSPAAALSCSSVDQSCCCAPNGKEARGHCPMVKATPSPVLAVLAHEVSGPPLVVVTEFIPVIARVASEARGKLQTHSAQAPPGRAAFQSPSFLRGPPAFPA